MRSEENRHGRGDQHGGDQQHCSDDQHGGDHQHGIAEDAEPRLLTAVLVLLSAFMVAEVIVALTAHSLALLSDAAHMLSDVAAIGAALWALRLAARPAGGSWTFGWKRAEILSAAGNGVTLLVLGIVIAIEALRRLITPVHVQGGAVLVLAAVGIAVNLVATWLLARANRTNLNTEGAYQHILTDLYGFIGTLVAGVVIVTTGYSRADPIASLVVAALMVRAAWSLLHASGRILLEAAPENLDLNDIRAHLMQTVRVVAVHDLHVWTVTSNLPALSAHIVVEDDCFVDGHAPALLDEIQQCLLGHFDLEHSTFQLEPLGHTQHEAGTH